MPRKKENVPEDETPVDRFHRVANYRAKQVIKYLGMLERMPKQPSYDFEVSDIEKLQDAIGKEWEALNNTLQKAIDGTLKGKSAKEIKDIF